MDWLTPQIFVMTIVGILGTQVALFLAMMKLQEKNTDTQIENLRREFGKVQNKSDTDNFEESLSIKIYQPPEWANGKPKRKRNSKYKIGSIVGVASGNVKSAFLATRTSREGDLRILRRLSLEKDGCMGRFD